MNRQASRCTQGYTAARSTWMWLAGQIALSAICYAVILVMSGRFSPVTPGADRPLLPVLGLYWVSFLLYWSSLATALRLPSTSYLASIVFGAAVLFRAITLPSTPIQEIDIYRYMWDSAVTSSGGNPFRYTPQQVLTAYESVNKSTDGDSHLLRLVSLIDVDPALHEILSTVHYAHLTTPYPPVSQAVFAATAWLVPPGATVEFRLLMLKCVLVAFDLATLVLVMWMLRMAGRHVGWSIAYGWCPLVIKEFANSGHLDTIAIFFVTLAAAITVRSFGHDRVVGQNSTAQMPAGFGRSGWLSVLASAVALALGIGAKVFPAVLLPLLMVTWWRRQEWQVALGGLAAVVSIATICLAPMVITDNRSDQATGFASVGPLAWPSSSSARTSTTEPLAPPPISAAQQSDPRWPDTRSASGLWNFLERWEMNDLIFLLLVENLRPQREVEPAQRPWFVIVPDELSEAWLGRWTSFLASIARVAGFEDTAAGASSFASIANLHDRPFIASSLLARAIVAAVLVIIALVLARSATLQPIRIDSWLRACFLTLAWCWLLLPTQNPWYLCWALPLLPFVRAKAWYGLSAFAMMYYLRFWLEHHFPETGAFGTPYSGAYVFHFVIPWIEFGPWLVWLVVDCCVTGNRTSPSTA